MQVLLIYWNSTLLDGRYLVGHGLVLLSAGFFARSSYLFYLDVYALIGYLGILFRTVHWKKRNGDRNDFANMNSPAFTGSRRLQEEIGSNETLVPNNFFLRTATFRPSGTM